jgi:hypothetical protein
MYMIARQQESEAKKEVQQALMASMTGKESISDGQ